MHDDDRILDNFAAIANGIAARTNAVQKPGPVTDAVELLLRRLVHAGNSLRVLYDRARDDFPFDGAMILRGIYDTMLQSLYILADPSRRESRARLYLDFYWVERHTEIELFDQNPTVLARKLKTSAKRAQAEPEIDTEFQRVRSTFLNSRGKLRRAWYAGSLRELAKEVGFESEYEILQRQLSGAVHSSPLALKDGPRYPARFVLRLAWHFSYRVLGRFADFKGVSLDEHERQVVDISFKNVYDHALPE